MKNVELTAGSFMFRTINILRFILTPRDKKRLLGLSFLSTLAALWEVAGIGLMVPVVAAVVNPELLEQNGLLKTFYQLSPCTNHRSFMLFSALLVVVNFGLKNFYSYLLIRLQSYFIFQRQHELSVRLFSLLMQGEYACLLGNPPSELCARVQRVKIACEGTLLPMMLLGSDALAVAALTAALFFFMPLSLMAALAALLVLAWAFYLPFRRVNSRLSADYVKYNTLTLQDVMTGFNGMKAVKSSGCEDYVIDRFRKHITDGAQVDMRIFSLGQIPRLGLEFLAVALAMGIFIGMIAGNVASGTIVLNFALLIAAMGRILPALSRMHYNLTRLRQVGMLLEDLYKDLSGCKVEQGLETPQKDIHLRNALEIKDLSFAYPDGRTVFENFSCVFPANTSTALIGPTGCGKTTLADLITGLLKPQCGSITFDGVPLAENLRSARKIIGYVPQNVFLLEGSIAENVVFGSADYDEKRIKEALVMANLAEFVETLPQGIHHRVGENGLNLSGGQRQRLGIARALYREPELLILDEATSALDNASENAVVEALEKLHGRLTMLVIAHRLSTIEHCDKKIDLAPEKIH